MAGRSLQYGFAFLLQVTLLMIVVPARAQEDDSSGNICVTALLRWNGMPEEVRSIRINPVPESYRKGGQNCGGPLLASDLIDWHSRFGTEASAHAAFEFVERRDQHIREGAKLATDTIRAASRSRANTDLSAPFRQLRELLGPPALAMTIAETFDARSSRDKAVEWLAAFDALRARIGQAPSRSEDIAPFLINEPTPFEEGLKESGIDETAAALRTRIALFDASQSLAETDRQRLDSLIEQRTTLALKSIMRFAFEAGGDFCDVPDYADEAVKQACNDEPDFERQAKIFLFQKAMAALLHDDDSLAEGVLRLYERGGKDRDWQTRLTGIDPRIVMLKTARAEMLLRKASKSVHSNGRPAQNLYDMQWGLEQLVEVTRLFSPVDDPVHFRRIATRALTSHAELVELRKQQGNTADSRLDPAMSYFRLMLPRLDDIAGGTP